MGKSKWIVAALLASAGMLGTAAQAASASVYVQVAPAYTWTPAEYGYERHYGAYRYGDRFHRRVVDRDRDGIPDYRDNDLDNDGRANRYDRDRDGDGISNRRDRAPDNRYRY